jgi:hypothetical protein
MQPWALRRFLIPATSAVGGPAAMNPAPGRHNRGPEQRPDACRAHEDDLTKPPDMFSREVQQTVDDAAKAADAINKATSQINAATIQMTELKKDADDARVPVALKKAEDDITKAKATMSAATKNATAALGQLPPNPPIDSIAHQVSFAVALSANATPNWTLVHFKGPGTANTFAAASRTFTHTLSIAMGSPSDSGAGKVSLDQIRQLEFLNQQTAYRNSLLLRSSVLQLPF